MNDSPNPFAAPQVGSYIDQAEQGDLTQVEATRRELLSHEASIRSLGTLFYLGAAFFALLVGGGIIATVIGLEDRDEMWIIAPLYTAIAVAGALAGFWFRRLDPRAKIVVGVLAGIGLFAIPCGTLGGGYSLWLVFSRKGRMVLSQEYKEVVRQTPHIKYETSLLVKILVVALLVVLGLIVVAVIVGGNQR